MAVTTASGVNPDIAALAFEKVKENKANGTGTARLSSRQAEALIAEAAAKGKLDPATLAFIESLTSEVNAEEMLAHGTKAKFEPTSLSFDGKTVTLEPVQDATLEAIAKGYMPTGNPKLDKKTIEIDQRVEKILNAKPPLPPEKLFAELEKLGGDFEAWKKIAGKGEYPAVTYLLTTKFKQAMALGERALCDQALKIDPKASVVDLKAAFAKINGEYKKFLVLGKTLGVDTGAAGAKFTANLAMVVDAALGELSKKGIALAGKSAVSMNDVRALMEEYRALQKEAELTGVPLAEDRLAYFNEVKQAVVAKRIATLNQALTDFVAKGGDIKQFSQLLAEYQDLGLKEFWGDPVLKPMLLSLRDNFASIMGTILEGTGVTKNPEKMTAEGVKVATAMVALAGEFGIPLPASLTKNLKANLEMGAKAATESMLKETQAPVLAIAEIMSKNPVTAEDLGHLQKCGGLIFSILNDKDHPLHKATVKMMEDPNARQLYNAAMLVTVHGTGIGTIRQAIQDLGTKGFNNLCEKVLLSEANLLAAPDKQVKLGNIYAGMSMAVSGYAMAEGEYKHLARLKAEEHPYVGFVLTTLGSEAPWVLSDKASAASSEASDYTLKMKKALKEGNFEEFERLQKEAFEKGKEYAKQAILSRENDIALAEKVVKGLEYVKTGSDVAGLLLGLPGLAKLGGAMALRTFGTAAGPKVAAWVLTKSATTVGAKGAAVAATEEAAALGAKKILEAEGRWAAGKAFSAAFAETALPTFSKWSASAGASFAKMGLQAGSPVYELITDASLSVIQLVEVDEKEGIGIHLYAKDPKTGERTKFKWLDVATAVGGTAFSLYGLKGAKVKHVEVPEGAKIPDVPHPSAPKAVLPDTPKAAPSKAAAVDAPPAPPEAPTGGASVPKADKPKVADNTGFKAEDRVMVPDGKGGFVAGEVAATHPDKGVVSVVVPEGPGKYKAVEVKATDLKKAQTDAKGALDKVTFKAADVVHVPDGQGGFTSGEVAAMHPERGTIEVVVPDGPGKFKTVEMTPERLKDVQTEYAGLKPANTGTPVYKANDVVPMPDGKGGYVQAQVAATHPERGTVEVVVVENGHPKVVEMAEGKLTALKTESKAKLGGFEVGDVVMVEKSKGIYEYGQVTAFDAQTGKMTVSMPDGSVKSHTAPELKGFQAKPQEVVYKPEAPVAAGDVVKLPGDKVGVTNSTLGDRTMVTEAVLLPKDHPPKVGDEVTLPGGKRGQVLSVEADGRLLVVDSNTGMALAKVKPSELQWSPGDILVTPSGKRAEVWGVTPDGKVVVTEKFAKRDFVETAKLAPLDGFKTADEVQKLLPHGNGKETWVKSTNPHNGQTELWEVKGYDPTTGNLKLEKPTTEMPLIKQEGTPSADVLDGFPGLTDPKSLRKGDVIVDANGYAWRVEKGYADNVIHDGGFQQIEGIVVSRVEVREVPVSRVLAESRAPGFAPTTLTDPPKGGKGLIDDLRTIWTKKQNPVVIDRIGAANVTVGAPTVKADYEFPATLAKGKQPKFHEPELSNVTAEDFDKLPAAVQGQPAPTITDKHGNKWEVLSVDPANGKAVVKRPGASASEDLYFARSKEKATVYAVKVTKSDGTPKTIEVAVAHGTDGKPIYTEEQIKALVGQFPRRDVDAIDVIRFNSSENWADPHWRKEFNDPSHVSAATAGPEGTGLDTKKVIDFYPAGNMTGDPMYTLTYHEFGHLSAHKFYGSEVPAATWDAAMGKDGYKFVSKYGANNKAEDFAETVSVYFMTNGGTKSLPPHEAKAWADYYRQMGYTELAEVLEKGGDMRQIFGARFKVLDDLFGTKGAAVWAHREFEAVAARMAARGKVAVGAVAGVGAVGGAGYYVYSQLTEDKAEPAK